MKKLYFIIMALAIVSCKDALEESPKSIAVETYYNTADEVKSAVNAIYAPLRSENCIGGIYLAGVECCTDYTLGRASYSNYSDFQGLSSTNITRAGTIWTSFYLSIRNANIVIANAPNGKKISSSDVAIFVGEAKFLRALSYFYLVRNWGGVPLRTEKNMTVRDVARSTADEIYQFIISDLKEAETNLPNKPLDIGRPSKWSAKTVLADVYFYMGKQAETVSKANEVIQSGAYSLVEISASDDFYNIFGPKVVNTTEEIFYLKFYAQRDQGFYYPNWTHYPSDGYYNGAGIYACYSDTVKFSFYSKWNNKDLRKRFNWYPYQIGLGNTTILNKKYIDKNAVTDRAETDYTMYRYADLLLMYAEAAARAANGPTADAMEKLNMVHRRAYGYKSTVASAVDFKLSDYNLTSFIDLVIQERMYEQMIEGKRYLDLKRAGKLQEMVKAARGITVVDTQLLWPIPTVETNYNLAIDPTKDQNPGY